MHELAVAEDLCAMALQAAAGARVAKIVVRVGALSGVVPDALRLAFEVTTPDTPLAGAALEIERVPGRARCRDCAREFAVDDAYGVCACGGAALEWMSGAALELHALEVFDDVRDVRLR